MVATIPIYEKSLNGSHGGSFEMSVAVRCGCPIIAMV
jgi:hypothetical protein